MRRVLALFCILLFGLPVVAQHYVLYGTTTTGGSSNFGTIFKYDPLTGTETTLFNFNGSDGSNAISSLFLASDGLLYGTSAWGGVSGEGLAYSFDPYTYQYTILFNSSASNGGYSENNFIEFSKGKLYSVDDYGGTKNKGVLFLYDISTKNDSVLYCFDSIHGSGPDANLIQDTITKLIYGMTYNGGSKDGGVLFSFNPFTNKDSVLIDFDSANGWMPNTITPVLTKNGFLYGMTSGGGTYGAGVIFRYNTSTGQDTVIYNFDGTHGEQPWANNLIQASNGLIYGMAAFGGALGGGVLFSVDPTTNIYTELISFNTTNGGNSAYGYLLQDPDNGLIYGATEGGNPASNYGVIFSYNITTGKDSVLYKFNNTDGANPIEMTLVKDTLTGINEVQANKMNVGVFPNPSTGIFTFQMHGINQRSEIKVYNMLGEKIYNASINSTSTQINLSSQSAGIYLYRIITERGEQVATGKLIIK